MVRIDMSEYMERHSVSRLVGAPPGYVGYDEGGQLTEAVRRRPYNVVLLDEVEKAHPEVWNVLLQVLDEGRLTDNQGRTVDFTNTVIVLTSNLGAEFLLDAAEGSGAGGMPHAKRRHTDPDDTEEKYDPGRRAAHDAVMKVVKKTFRPELLNRLDDVIIFDPLSAADQSHILRLQLVDLEERLKEQRVKLEITDGALEYVLSQAYNPAYGARPLKRYLEKHVATHISRMLISGELTGEGQRVTIDADAGGLQYAVDTVEVGTPVADDDSML
jgi:ATP-dependent Clp protease ATP-binding subunit ClpB